MLSRSLHFAQLFDCKAKDGKENNEKICKCVCLVSVKVKTKRFQRNILAYPSVVKEMQNKRMTTNCIVLGFTKEIKSLRKLLQLKFEGIVFEIKTTEGVPLVDKYCNRTDDHDN